jgi:GT2 family glycosyltransferase
MNGFSPDATIIIPQYERAELTVECVRSLRAADTAPWPVIVVDDESTAAALTRLLLGVAAVRDVTVVPQERRGVTAAWNVGADRAATPYLVFLNNDSVSEGEWVDELLRPLREGRGMVSGVRFRRECLLPRRVLERLPTRWFLEGWCFAMSQDDWFGAGGFDEELRLYFSDTDFQARIVEACGGDRGMLREVPGLAVRHLGRQTTRRLPERKEVWRRDREAFVAKWGG